MHRINKISVFILALILSACATNKDIGSSGNKQDDDNSVEFTARNLADHIRGIPRLMVRGSGNNIQVYNATVSTIKSDRRPLFIVDGIQMGRNFTRVAKAVDNRSVFSVEFMRMSKATTRYGGLGRNGVIFINTSAEG